MSNNPNLLHLHHMGFTTLGHLKDLGGKAKSKNPLLQVKPDLPKVSTTSRRPQVKFQFLTFPQPAQSGLISRFLSCPMDRIRGFQVHPAQLIFTFLQKEDDILSRHKI